MLFDSLLECRKKTVQQVATATPSANGAATVIVMGNESLAFDRSATLVEDFSTLPAEVHNIFVNNGIVAGVIRCSMVRSSLRGGHGYEHSVIGRITGEEG